MRWSSFSEGLNECTHAGHLPEDAPHAQVLPHPPWDMLPGMIGRLGMLISRLFRWLIPDPFVIAILLSLVTVLAVRTVSA